LDGGLQKEAYSYPLDEDLEKKTLS